MYLRRVRSNWKCVTLATFTAHVKPEAFSEEEEAGRVAHLCFYFSCLMNVTHNKHTTLCWVHSVTEQLTEKSPVEIDRISFCAEFSFNRGLLLSR